MWNLTNKWTNTIETNSQKQIPKDWFLQGEVQAMPRGGQQLEPPSLPRPICLPLGSPPLHTSPSRPGSFSTGNLSPAVCLWLGFQLPPEGGGGEMAAGPLGYSVMPLPFYGLCPHPHQPARAGTMPCPSQSFLGLTVPLLTCAPRAWP